MKVHGNTKHGHARRGANSKTFRTWQGIRNRCYNSSCPQYQYYGGRDIIMSDAWVNSFEAFLNDMGESPEGLSIDRIDNNGNYCKENCRWATQSEQTQNQRRQSSTGIKGVSVDRRRGYVAYSDRKYGYQQLYMGPDFFEACCRRKAWEALPG